MDLSIDSSDDNVDILYSLARRYPLLSSEEEKSVDASKWLAVEAILCNICADSCGIQWVTAILEHLRLNPPKVEDFSSREHFFQVQRDIRELHKHDRKLNRQALFELFHAGHLPATLVVALAELLLGKIPARTSPVAKALTDYLSFKGQDLRPNISTHEENQDLRRQISGYIEARDKLTLHNLRLVFTIAGRHSNRQVPYSDLVQEGVIGLLRAAEKYQYKTGNRFSTYAFNWISQAVRRLNTEQGAVLRYPTHVQEQINRLYRIRSQRWAIGEQMTSAELALETGLSDSKVRELLALRNLPTSLNAPVHDEEGASTLGDTLEGGPYIAQEDSAWRVSLGKLLQKRLGKLDPAEAEVVERRWGLDGSAPMSRAQLAEKLSVSREWIRQLETNALRKLKGDPVIADTYTDYIAE